MPERRLQKTREAYQVKPIPYRLAVEKFFATMATTTGDHTCSFHVYNPKTDEMDCECGMDKATLAMVANGYGFGV